jgi:hypothetical protein
MRSLNRPWRAGVRRTYQRHPALLGQIWIVESLAQRQLGAAKKHGSSDCFGCKYTANK